MVGYILYSNKLSQGVGELKYIAWVFFAFVLQYSASTQAATREECLPIELIAEDIMLARQNNAGMSDIMYRYSDSETAQVLIMRAYDRYSAFSTEKIRLDVIKEFKNYAFIKCIKGELIIDTVINNAQVSVRKEAVSIDNAITAEVSGKSSAPIDTMIAGNSIAIDVLYQNNSGKKIARFDGAVVITSLRDVHLLNFDVTVDGEIPSGNEKFRRGNLIPYSGLSQKAFLDADKNSIKTTLVLRSVLFSDGTLLQR